MVWDKTKKMKEEGECISANNKVREYVHEKKTFEQKEEGKENATD